MLFEVDNGVVVDQLIGLAGDFAVNLGVLRNAGEFAELGARDLVVIPFILIPVYEEDDFYFIDLIFSLSKVFEETKGFCSSIDRSKFTKDN